MRNKARLELCRLLICILIALLILNIVNAQEIKYCDDSISICSMSAAGKGESPSDGTLDSCADGTEADTLAYVKNLTIRDLNNSRFYVNDTVEVYGLFGCSASNDGFRYALVYNYGNYTLNSGNAISNWSTLVTADCDANSDVTLYYNLTLANIVGNHTIRGLITYKYRAISGCSVPTNLTCGSEHEDATDCFSSRWSETDDITFLVLDNQAPNVTLSYPANNSWAATTPISFNFTATDNRAALSNCTLFTNFSGTFQANATIRLPANGSAQNISARPSDGNYVWNIRCFDNSSNSNFSINNYTINVDTTFPRVEFVGVTPANNSFQSSRTVTINVSINESNRANVSFNWNGSNSTTLDNAYSIFWNITNSSLNGTYSIYVFVNDSAGNANTTLTRQFTIDTVSPATFTLILPANNSVAGSAANLSPLLNWTATTEENFQNYTIQFSDNISFPYANRTFVTTGNISNTSFKITENLANNVTWFWRVVAYDKAGNLNASNLTFVYITNTSDPSVVLNYPTNNYISKFTNLSFNHTPSDANLQRCELVANFSGTWKGNRSEGSPISDIVNNIANVTLIDGNYIWNVNCSDSGGLIAFAPTNFTLTVDLTFPKVEFLSPTPANGSAQSSTTVVINVSINESARDTIVLNFNGTNETNTLTNDFSIYWSITKEDLAGTYDIYVFVNDSAGNANTTLTRRFTVDNTASTIVNETVSPRAAVNNSIFNITAVITDEFNVNSTISEIQKPDGTKENTTMNRSGGDIYSATFNGTTNGTFIVIIYANDSVNNRAQTNPFNFTVDILQPNISGINFTPSSIDRIDPNVSINVSATVTDNFLVGTVLILYKKDTDTTWSNTTASNVSNLYWGNFTPNSEANWSFAVWANDTSGNVNISANTTINVTYDFTWNVTPIGLGVIGGVKGTNNVVLGNVTINNTGEFTMNFTLSKKSGVPSISFNISNINVSNHSTEVVQILANAPATASTYVIEVDINSTNQSASPISRVVNATFSVTEGGPFLFLEIVKFDSSVSTSSTSSLSAKLTNTGNDTCTNGIAEWALPSDWTILAGLTGEKNISLGNVGVGAISYHNLTVQVGSSTGSKTITIAGNCSNGGVNNTLSQTVTVTSTGGGGSGGGGGSNVKSSQSQVYANIPAGSSFSLEINKADIGFTKITVIADKELKNVGITVSSLLDKPVIKSASSKVYQYLELTKSNIVESDVGRITIGFKVPKKWLSDNNLLPNEISLYRYELNQWNELITKIAGDDDTYIFYDAESPGFSLFAIGTKIGVEPGISMIVNELVEAVRGQSMHFMLNITNKNINTTLKNLTLKVEGFLSSQINVYPDIIPDLSFSETKSFNISISVPSYFNEGKYQLRLLINGKKEKGLADVQDIMLFKNVTLVVFKTLRAQAEFCLIEADKEFGEMEKNGFNIQKVNELFSDSKKALDNFEYGKAKEICEQLRSLNAKAFKASEEIGNLRKEIEELKEKGFDMGSAEKALQIALEAFENGEFDKAEDFVKEAKLIVTLQVKSEESSILARLKRFVVNYWWALILSILLISVAGLYTYSRYSAAMIKNELKDLDSEESTLLESIKKAQREYFIDKSISRGLYDKYIDKYRARLAKVKQEIISLKVRRIKIAKFSEGISDLEKEKYELSELIKDLQKKYFEEKIFGKNFYDRVASECKNRIAEIENKILLKQKRSKHGADDVEKSGAIKYFEKLYNKIAISVNLVLEKIKGWFKRKEDKQVFALAKKQIEVAEEKAQETEKQEIQAQEPLPKESKKSILSKLKDKFQLSKAKGKTKSKDEGNYQKDTKKLEGHGFKVKPNIIPKSEAVKHNILRHLKEVHENER